MDQDYIDEKVAPRERQPSGVMRLLQLLAKRRIHPAKNEGWHTTNTLADSEAEGDGSPGVPSSGAPDSGQN